MAVLQTPSKNLSSKTLTYKGETFQLDEAKISNWGTVEPLFTDTRLIQTPVYNGHFRFSRRK